MGLRISFYRKPKTENRKPLWLLILLIALPIHWSNPTLAADRTDRTVYVLTATGSINPGSAEFILSGIRSAEQAQAEVLVIQLDTPGGLDSSMRQIIQGIINAKVPVIVYVAPQGARAASAGFIISQAAPIAAMAPGTNIGAAHPVALGAGKMDKVMGEKVVNDMAAYVRSLAQERGRNVDWAEKAVRQSISISASEAKNLKVVDLLADNLDDLLKKVNGRQVKVGQKNLTLETAQAKLFFVQEGMRHQILKRIADPNVAFILMMIGLAGLYFELAHPGVVLPGVVGAMALVLALYAFQALPVNFIGVLLIFLSFIFFILEIFVISYGLLSVAGVVSLVMGAMMLFQVDSGMGIAWSVLIPTVIAIVLFCGAIASLALRSHLRRPMTGAAGLIGERGVARTPLEPDGRIFIHGEYWVATCDEPVRAGEEVEVIEVANLKLLVRRVEPIKKGVA
jgi:membrane-bound serine protease (ClpP class)